MSKRKADQPAAPEQSKRQKTQISAPRAKERNGQWDANKSASNGVEKAFRRKLKEMRKKHRMQIAKVKGGQQIEPEWEEKRKSIIEILRTKGMLKDNDEGEFGWPADVTSSKYESSVSAKTEHAVKKSFESDSEYELAAEERVLVSQTDQVDTRLIKALDVQKTADRKGEVDGRILFSGDVITTLANITGGQGDKPDLVLKLNIQIVQREPQ